MFFVARALATVFHKVGLLPAGEEHQVPFAYKLYTDTSEAGRARSAAFKETFSLDVDIAFIKNGEHYNCLNYVDSVRGALCLFILFTHVHPCC